VDKFGKAPAKLEPDEWEALWDYAALNVLRKEEYDRDHPPQSG